VNRSIALFAVGMVLTLALWWMGATLLVPWGIGIMDQWDYGTARLSQLDANVGHGGISHFIAQYDNGQVIVIEFRGGDPTKARTFSQLVLGTDQTLRVVTLEVRDINNDGKPDLLIHVEGMSIGFILYNTGDSFQATPPRQ